MNLFGRSHCHTSILMVAISLLGLSLVNAQNLDAQDDQTVTEYVVDLSDARNHYVTIRMVVPCSSETTELMMAVWTPGSYLVREYARHIDSLSITDDKSQPIEFEKTRKNRWTVQTEGLTSFKVSYRLYCNEMTVRTNWVGSQFAVLNGAPTFLTVPEYRSFEHRIQLALPKGWSRSATSLAATDSANGYSAASFDELVDSPIVAGNVSVYPFEVSGVPHQLVNVGESGYWDGTKAAADLKKIVKAHQDMWGTVPYKRYLFLNIICGSGGGLEHDNCCLMMTSIWNFRDKERYKDWLSLASHEFFHTWNVRRLRPRSLRNYDYENEVYTPSLWIAEGITSYYEDVLLVRAGLFSEREYITRLSKNIVSVQTKPGRTKQSLKESSYDTWIKFYRPSPNSSNTQISYYSKGAVVAFLLDAKIRKETEGEKSLDDVMRIMFERFEKDGYSPSDFRGVVDEVVGADMRDFFRVSVDSAEELDFEPAKEWFGFKFGGDKRNPGKSDKDSKDDDGPKKDAKNEEDENDDESDVDAKDESDAESTGDAEDNKQKSGSVLGALLKTALVNAASAMPDKPKGPPWIGVRMRDGKITSVEPDSPASRAGLSLSDEILGVNGFRVRSSIDSRLRQYKIGDEIELLVSRRDQLLTINVTIEGKQNFDWKWSRVSKPMDDQKKNFKSWLRE